MCAVSVDQCRLKNKVDLFFVFLLLSFFLFFFFCRTLSNANEKLWCWLLADDQWRQTLLWTFSWDLVTVKIRIETVEMWTKMRMSKLLPCGLHLCVVRCWNVLVFSICHWFSLNSKQLLRKFHCNSSAVDHEILPVERVKLFDVIIHPTIVSIAYVRRSYLILAKLMEIMKGCFVSSFSSSLNHLNFNQFFAITKFTRIRKSQVLAYIHYTLVRIRVIMTMTATADSELKTTSQHCWCLKVNCHF